jgi:hypothetical protein
MLTRVHLVARLLYMQLLNPPPLLPHGVMINEAQVLCRHAFKAQWLVYVPPAVTH